MQILDCVASDPSIESQHMESLRMIMALQARLPPALMTRFGVPLPGAQAAAVPTASAAELHSPRSDLPPSPSADMDEPARRKR